MSNKKSFCISYKLKEESCNEEVVFDAHINLWNIGGKKSKPFIDFGILIHNYAFLESICFSAPLKTKQDNIVDLSHFLKAEEIQLIFNNSKYKYQQINQVYSSYVDDSDKTNLILPIKKNDNNLFLSYIDYDSTNEGKSNFSFKIKFLECGIPNGNEIESVYIRFRITNLESTSLLSTLPIKNNFLESAFIERQILDFKLNNVRNIDKYDLSDMSNNGYSLAQFRNIHLFVMVPSDYEITTWGNFSECRQLEKDEWNNYLGNKANIITSDISAYHWKYKSNSDSYVDEFAQLIKMEHKSTNLFLIIIYCFIAILLGIAGSVFYDLIKMLIGI